VLKNLIPAPAAQSWHAAAPDQRFRSRRYPENIGSPCEQLPLPIRYLIGVNLKLRGQFGQRLVLAQRR
jgi:hypothetical protein